MLFSYLSRFVRRFIVLVPGLLMAYVAVKDIFPFFDKHVPDAIAVLLTYIITAYILIPAIMRFFRIIFKPQHVPLYCTTPDGFASDPINIGVLATREELVVAMTRAGWYLADNRSVKNLIKMGLSILVNRPYPAAPFSHLYLFGRSQDIGFELPLDHDPRHRHHVRFWASTYNVDPRFRPHVYFWQRHFKSDAPDRLLWLGAASLDVGVGLIRHNAQLTHQIDPDTNAERDLIISQLQQTKLVAKTRQVTLDDPYRLVNRVWRGYLTSDGKMTIAELKKSSQPPKSSLQHQPPKPKKRRLSRDSKS